MTFEKGYVSIEAQHV